MTDIYREIIHQGRLVGWLTAAAFGALLSAPSAEALIISPTFESSITGDANAAAIEATINTAINIYNTTFTDPITVTIQFGEMSSGLGQSLTGLYGPSYTNFITALHNDATSSADATALAHLPIQAGNPVTGSSTINGSSANLRALGFNAPGFVNGTFDGEILLNTSLTNVGSPGSTLQYSLQVVAEHEIDEVLGLGSDVGQTGFFANPRAEDLFRYDSAGNRSYTTAGDNAFFSIDGTTDLVQFNQSGVGDYGDWHTSATPRVQDAFGTPGANPSLGVELTALDVIGYDRAATPVPEPGSVALLSTALLGLGFMRRRRARR